MKKEDLYLRNREIAEPQFSDSDYQQDMRVDPLTTMDDIREEIDSINQRKEERRKEQEAERLAKEAEERKQYEAWKASRAEQNGNEAGSSNDE